MSDDPYPFGTPVNRPDPRPDLVPHPSRGIGWHVDRKGRDVYVEPPRKTMPEPAKK